MRRHTTKYLEIAQPSNRATWFARTRGIPLSFRPAIAEGLESRTLLSVFYDLSVIAKTGDQTSGDQTITSIGNASVNDAGQVAFDASITGGTGVLVGDGLSAAKLITFSPTATRQFSFPQINNAGQVSAADRVSGSPPVYFVRTWDSTNPPSFQVDATSNSSPGQPASPFDSVLVPSLASDGGVGFVALVPQAGSGDLTKLEYVAPPIIGSNGNQQAIALATLSGGGFRPMAAAGGRVVVFSGSGGSGSLLVGRASAPDNPLVLASTSSGNWSSLGQAPGISDDGQVVAFYGTLTPAGAASVNARQPNLPVLQPGAGVFAYVDDSGQSGTYPSLIRVAGEPVGGRNELGFDTSRNPITFSSFNSLSRVGVIHQSLGASGLSGDSFTFVFDATPSADSHVDPSPSSPLLFAGGKEGLWSVRVDYDSSSVASQPDAAFPFVRYSAQPVVQVGDSVGGAVITAGGLSVSDPIAIGQHSVPVPSASASKGDHRIVFVANTSSGQEVVSASQFDTDGDGLYDHWETKGIDFGNGPVLNLAALGANPFHKDLFMQADWTGASGTFKSDQPASSALQGLSAIFAAAPVTNPDGTTGIQIHIDAGTSSVGFPLSAARGGQTITDSAGNRPDVVYLDSPANAAAYIEPGLSSISLQDVKAKEFDAIASGARELAFHYVAFADYYEFAATTGAILSPVTNITTGSNGGTQLTLPLLNLSQSVANNLKGDILRIAQGTGAGEESPIADATPVNGDLVITLYDKLNIPPDSTSRVTLLSGSSGKSEISFVDPNNEGGSTVPFDSHTLPGNDLIVTLGSTAHLHPPDGSLAQAQLQTLLHELGHNLGLQHGGTDSTNAYRPGYLSVMSYNYQFGDNKPYDPTTNPKGYITNYSTGGVFNDWANLRLNFPDNLVTLNNSSGFLAAGANSPSPDDELPPAQMILQQNPSADIIPPAVNLLSPANAIVVSTGQTLTVRWTASDNQAVSSTIAQFDPNGDGTDETLAGQLQGGVDQVSFGPISGPGGNRTLTVTAYDSSGNATVVTIDLTVAASAAIPGDANGDGKVDFSDLLILAQHYGDTNAILADGDFNGDGTVNFADLLILAQNYGRVAGQNRFPAASGSDLLLHTKRNAILKSRRFVIPH